MKTSSKIIVLLGAAASSQAAFQATDLAIERQNTIALAQAEAETCQEFTDGYDTSDCCCGCCGCCCWSYEAPAYWWTDTWYSWGDDWYYTESAYWANNELYYCASSGTLYMYDPAAWGWYPGWTMNWAGSCNPSDFGSGEQDDDWWVDTWYWWGDDWYYTDNAYWIGDDVYYCSATGTLYVYDPATWGWYPGWTMVSTWQSCDGPPATDDSYYYYYASDDSSCSVCNYSSCSTGSASSSDDDWWVDTWYSWGYDWYNSGNQYWANNSLYYCTDSGSLYVFDPSAWGYYDGWTMSWAGSCDGSGSGCSGGCCGCGGCGCCGCCWLAEDGTEVCEENAILPEEFN